MQVVGAMGLAGASLRSIQLAVMRTPSLSIAEAAAVARRRAATPRTPDRARQPLTPPRVAYSAG